MIEIVENILAAVPLGNYDRKFRDRKTVQLFNLISTLKCGIIGMVEIILTKIFKLSASCRL
tara:strand:- start:1069 stop:1251 length:183 start_codon:yes stop_codon:yes gene_type:complete